MCAALAGNVTESMSGRPQLGCKRIVSNYVRAHHL